MKQEEDLKISSAPVPEHTQEPSRCLSTQRLWTYGLGAGVLAGLAAGLIGEGVLEWFNPNINPASIHAPAAELHAQAALLRRTEIQQVALAMGLLGGLLGLSLGLASGLARRSVRAAGMAAVVGLILGTAAGMGSSFCVMPYYIINRNFIGGSFRAPLLIHAALWVPIGAMGGLALGLGLGEWRRTARAVLGGLVGGALGTLLYEVLSAILFPLSLNYQPLSDTWDSRVTARLLVALFSAGLAVAFVCQDTSNKVGHPPSSPEIQEDTSVRSVI